MAFFFLCIYLFFLFIRPQDWYMTGLGVFRPILLTQLSAIIFTTIELIMGKLKLPHVTAPWFIIMTGLLFGIVFSHIGNFYLDGAITGLTEFGKTYLTFILIWINLNSAKRITIFNAFLVAMAAFIAVHCILVSQTGSGFGSGGAITRSDSEGIIQAQYYGILSDPNDTAQILVLTVPLCIFIMLRISNVILRIIPLGIILTLMWGILATESRGGFISMAITCFIALRGFFSPGKFVASFIIGVVFFFAFAPARFRGGMVDESSSSRVAFWGEATEAFKSNPLFGVGYDTIHEHTSSGHTVHNSYVQAYSELGVFGYSFWLCAIVFAIYSMLRLSKVFPENDEELVLTQWMKCAVPALAGCYAIIFFLSRAYLIPMYVTFAMVAACYEIASQKLGAVTINQYCHISQKYIVIWLGLALGSMVLIYLGIRVLNLVT